MLIYNQRLHPSLANHSPLEVHHEENTLEIFIKQYSNKGRQMREKKFNVGFTVRIIRTTEFSKRGNICGTLNFLYCRKS